MPTNQSSDVKADVKADVQARLAALRREYAIKLKRQLQTLVAQVHSADRTQWIDILPDLHHQLHKLAGAAGTFGFPAVGHQARQLEILAKSWLDQDREISDPLWMNFQEQIEKLPDLLNQPDLQKDHRVLPAAPPIPSQPPSSVTGPPPSPPTTIDAACNQPSDDFQKPRSSAATDLRRIYVLDGEFDCREKMSQTLQNFGYEALCIDTLSDLQNHYDPTRRAALLAEIKTTATGYRFLEDLARFQTVLPRPVPAIFVTEQNDFETYLAVARVQGKGCFIRPLDFPKLVDRLDVILQQRDRDPYRIMIVDDDIDLARHFQLTLEAAGMQARVVSQAFQVLDVAVELRPELILMDINMPEYSGIELARALRLQDQWVSTPIVYLSAITDLDEQIRAMDTAGDDFLTKPISDRHLVAAVRIRVSRARLLSSFMTRDSLTGLMNHIRIKEQIASEVSRARRKSIDVCVAMLDIDHFKQVNDTYGHAEGDKVIKTLAHLLRQRLRKSDSIGRYGGEEFAVVLPDCDMANAQELLESIRLGFQNIRFIADHRGYSVTLSGGIASITQHGDPEALIGAADEALYAAKHGGRNRVCVVPETQ